jgi:hypothetical protein
MLVEVVEVVLQEVLIQLVVLVVAVQVKLELHQLK